MKKFLIVTSLALAFSGAALADEHGHGHEHPDSVISDLLEGGTVAASLYSGAPEAIFGIEMQRYPAGVQPQGVNVRLFSSTGAEIAVEPFQCPYEGTTREISACNSLARREAAPEFAAMIEATEGAALALTTPVSGWAIDLKSVVFLKAWKAPRRGIYYVRVGYQNQVDGTGSANYSCHAGGHGGDDNHMHCHYLSDNATGPNEPGVSR